MARDKTGRGQCIDAALYECAFSFMEPWIPAFEKPGHVANRTGSRLPESTPNNLYPTGDGSFIHITAMGDACSGAWSQAMGQPGLANDPRFAKALAAQSSNARGARRHHRRVDASACRWQMLESEAAEAAVPATRIFTIADIFDDPHYAARESIVAGARRAHGQRRDGRRGAAPVGDARRRAPRRPRRRAGHARGAAETCSA